MSMAITPGARIPVGICFSQRMRCANAGGEFSSNTKRVQAAARRRACSSAGRYSPGSPVPNLRQRHRSKISPEALVPATNIFLLLLMPPFTNRNASEMMLNSVIELSFGLGSQVP
jgi:hypothetical protein